MALLDVITNILFAILVMPFSIYIIKMYSLYNFDCKGTRYLVLLNLEMVIAKGSLFDHPKIKKRKQVEKELDKFL